VPIDGVVKNTIVVTGGVGEIEFASNRDRPGELRLDFDPRGQDIEVRHDATVFPSVAFPAEPC
jgi:hypothetical protein